MKNRWGYPAIIGIIGLLVVLRYALFDLVLTSDTGREFIVYSLVVETGKWQIVQPHSLLSSCLFTTYFPAMLQRAFGTDITMTYKLFPCFIMPVLPIAVYYLAKKQLTTFYAFLATCFLMGQLYFLVASAHSRVVIALVFFSLVLLVIFNSDSRFRTKIYLLIPLSLCLVVAHYGTVFVALFVVGITVAAMLSLRLIKKHSYPTLQAGVAFLVILAVVTVTWLGVINTIPLKYGQGMIRDTVKLKVYDPRDPSGEYIEVEEGGKNYGFFSLETRPPTVQIAFGKSLPDMDLPQKVKWGLSWLGVLMVSLGLGLVARHQGLRESWVLLMLTCYLAIAISVISPTVGLRYGVERVHFSAMVVLAPCFVIGSLWIAEKLKLPGAVVVLVLLVPYILSMSEIIRGIMRLKG